MLYHYFGAYKAAHFIVLRMSKSIEKHHIMIYIHFSPKTAVTLSRASQSASAPWEMVGVLSLTNVGAG